MKRRLRRIRRAAWEARDLVVLALRLRRDYPERATPIVAMIAERRAAVQPSIVRIADRCRRRDRFMRMASKLVMNVRPPRTDRAQPSGFPAWAKQQLGAVGAIFFASLPDKSSDMAALHEFRIRTKALRYTMELVAPAFGPEFRSDSYSIVEKLQERLGKIQDHVTAAARLAEWANSMPEGSERGVMRELATAESARLEEAVREFRSWWSAERVAALRGRLIPEDASSTPIASPEPLARQM